MAPPRASRQAGPLPPELGTVEGPSGTSGARDGRYDAVGYASWYGEEAEGGATASGQPFSATAITAAHRTLPLGSYAEVTALDSGRTILVLINDRGPGRPDREIDLSRGAAQLLGVGDTPVAAVRVRGVGASVQDAQALRSGRPAGGRLDAPPGLLAALRARLPKGTAAAPKRAATITRPTQARDRSVTAPTNVEGGRFVVQVATLSNRDRANALAKRLGGRAIEANGLWRVRLGPFDDRAKANRARDAAVAQGYGDAQIQTIDRNSRPD